MELITILCFLIIFIMIGPFLLKHLLQFFLRKYFFKIDIHSFFSFRNILLCFNSENSLSFFSSIKMFISSIKIKKTPKKLNFSIIIDKIHFKVHPVELALTPTSKTKIDELFTLNLMKILEFTKKRLNIKSKLINYQKPIEKSSESSRLKPMQIISKLFSFYFLSRFSIQINKITVDFIQVTEEESDFREFISPYEKIVSRFKKYHSSFWCDYNSEVKKLRYFISFHLIIKMK